MSSSRSLGVLLLLVGCGRNDDIEDSFQVDMPTFLALPDLVGAEVRFEADEHPTRSLLGTVEVIVPGVYVQRLVWDCLQPTDCDLGSTAVQFTWRTTSGVDVLEFVGPEPIAYDPPLHLLDRRMYPGQSVTFTTGGVQYETNFAFDSCVLEDVGPVDCADVTVTSSASVGGIEGSWRFIEEVGLVAFDRDGSWRMTEHSLFP